MKKIIGIATLFLLMVAGCSQKPKEAEISDVVKASFNKLFPAATDVKWSKESDSEFEAEFQLNNVKKSANFDQFGKWLITETEISHADLPEAVQNTLKNEFANYSTDEAELVEPADGSQFYEVELKSGKESFEVQISPDGKVLKKGEPGENDEEDEDDKD